MDLACSHVASYLLLSLAAAAAAATLRMPQKIFWGHAPPENLLRHSQINFEGIFEHAWRNIYAVKCSWLKFVFISKLCTSALENHAYSIALF